MRSFQPGNCGFSVLACGIAALAGTLSAQAADIAWTESFLDDPVAANRFTIPGGHDPARFSYDGGAPSLTVHYNSSEPTAWYQRPIDAQTPRALGRCDDFELRVTLRIRSDGFIADPNAFAQIAWGLINSQTTGEDRSGGSAGPYSYDLVTFDYFPNVSTFGGPTLGATILHTDTGMGFFSSFDFPFGTESDIDSDLGDVGPALDTLHTASVAYDSGAQTATLTLDGPGGAVGINADGTGGAGGPDGDPTTIQTTMFVDAPFEVDTFALTAWEDTFDFDPEFPSVVADVEVFEITFFARTLVTGDMNRDGLVDGLDIGPFVETLLAAEPSPCAVQRADFTNDNLATADDVADFGAALLGF